MYNLGYDELLKQIQQRFGISLTCFNSGGGCLIWETRLDDGTFLWITDLGRRHLLAGPQKRL